MTTFALRSLEDQDVKDSARAAAPIHGQQQFDRQRYQPISFKQFIDWKPLSQS